MRFLLLALMLSGLSATAEKKTCQVDGMHCQGCTEMVEGKICDEEKYSTCKVTVTDADKKKGQIELATKDKKSKIDEKALGAVIKDTGYKMKSCKTSKG